MHAFMIEESDVFFFIINYFSILVDDIREIEMDDWYVNEKFSMVGGGPLG